MGVGVGNTVVVVVVSERGVVVRCCGGCGDVTLTGCGCCGDSCFW